MWLRRIQAACLCFGLFCADACGQRLTLGPPPEPPELGQDTYCQDLIRRLEAEIAEIIKSRRGASPAQDTATRASLNTRILAADLLTAGEAAMEDGDLAVLQGITLAAGRRAIDDTLRKLIDLAECVESGAAVDDAQRKRLMESLRLVKLYNELAVEHAERVRTHDPARLDAVLPVIIAPLGEALALLDEQPLRTAWTPASRVKLPAGAVQGASVSPAIPRADVPADVEELSRRVSAAQLPEDVKAELLSILEYLRRGEEFAELRPRIDIYQERVAQAIDLADALESARPWLSREERRVYDERLKTGVLLFKDPRTRERGQRALDRLEASRSVIERVTTLRSLGDEGIIVPLARAFLHADAMVENPARADQGRARLGQLAEVLDRMIQFRTGRSAAPPRELRVVQKQLEDLYRSAESSLLAEIDVLGADSDPLTDPAFVSLLADHQQYLEDLLRITRIPFWIDTMTGIAPSSAAHCSSQVRKMTAWLTDPNRRPSAIAAMDQFERQLNLFASLPFEEELSRGADAAIIATGGQVEPLLRHLRAVRGEWASAWGDGDGAGPAAQRMLLLYRLTLAMEDASLVLAVDDDATMLNRWAGWQTSEEVFHRALTDLPARLKIATRAAIDGNIDELQAALNRIDQDLSVAKLIGRLTSSLRDDLREMPSGGVSTCAQLIELPRDGAWMAERRLRLARLCRHATEQEYAEALSRPDAVDRGNYVRGLAEGLLIELGDPRDPIPALSGFDGSDPMPSEAEDDTMRRLPARRR